MNMDGHSRLRVLARMMFAPTPGPRWRTGWRLTSTTNSTGRI
jgi:hypothetical protein